MPDKASWHTIDALPDLPPDLPINKADLQASLSQIVVPAWYQPDWLDVADVIVPDVPIEQWQQLRSWERSTIWRIPYPEGDQYLKAVPAMFAHEVPLTHWLAKRFPQHLPTLKPIVTNTALLTLDYGADDLTSTTDITIWARALRAVGEMQSAVKGDTDQLIAMGVPQRGFDWMATHVDAFITDAIHTKRGSSPLSEEEQHQLVASLPALHKRLAQLQTSPIPESLDHGDLWAGQIILYEDQILITDWSDSAVTMPFFSLSFFLVDVANHFPDVSDISELLRDAYLIAWESVADMETLHSLFIHTDLLADVYSAMRYHYDILPQMGQPWEMHNMIAFNLRNYLRKVG